MGSRRAVALLLSWLWSSVAQAAPTPLLPPSGRAAPSWFVPWSRARAQPSSDTGLMDGPFFVRGDHVLVQKVWNELLIVRDGVAGESVWLTRGIFDVIRGIAMDGADNLYVLGDSSSDVLFVPLAHGIGPKRWLGPLAESAMDIDAAGDLALVHGLTRAWVSERAGPLRELALPAHHAIVQLVIRPATMASPSLVLAQVRRADTTLLYISRDVGRTWTSSSWQTHGRMRRDVDRIWVEVREQSGDTYWMQPTAMLDEDGLGWHGLVRFRPSVRARVFVDGAMRPSDPSPGATVLGEVLRNEPEPPVVRPTRTSEPFSCGRAESPSSPPRLLCPGTRCIDRSFAARVEAQYSPDYTVVGAPLSHLTVFEAALEPDVPLRPRAPPPSCDAGIVVLGNRGLGLALCAMERWSAAGPDLESYVVWLTARGLPWLDGGVISAPTNASWAMDVADDGGVLLQARTHDRILDWLRAPRALDAGSFRALSREPDDHWVGLASGGRAVVVSMPTPETFWVDVIDHNGRRSSKRGMFLPEPENGLERFEMQGDALRLCTTYMHCYVVTRDGLAPAAP